MLLSDALGYALLAITVTATCVGGTSTEQEVSERKIERRSKRESAVLIDSFPPTNFKPNPEVIYQRVSKVRYRKHKPKYGPPKPHYGAKPKSRKPVKKYRSKQIRPNKLNKRVPKQKYGVVKQPHHASPKPGRLPPQYYYTPEPAGFGEPPKNLGQEYVQPPKQSYGEPPVVDSYGVPLQQNSFPTGETFAEPSNFNNAFAQQFQSFRSYQQDQLLDNTNSYSNNHPIYTEPEITQFNENGNLLKYENFNLDSYADVYKHSPLNEHASNYGKQKTGLNYQQSLQKNKPWKSKKLKNQVDNQDHIVVGGQYAEPPGRLVSNFQPSAPMFIGADEFAPSHSYLDSEVAASATVSPYVNYKNSNMAFSPQNLNDAFSILD